MTTAQIDTDKLMAFVFRAVDEVGATLNCALVHMGDQLGYYRDLAAARPDDARGAGRRGPGPRCRTPASGSTPRPPGSSSSTTPARGALHAAAGARGRADRRDQPGVPARLLPDRARHGPRLPPGRRRGTDRRRARLARAQRRRARGLRAVLPAGVRREPGGRVAAGARRRGREARSAEPRVADVGCGHGASTVLMAAGVPALDVHRARTTTPSRSRPRASGRPRPGSATAVQLRARVGDGVHRRGLRRW